MLFAIAATPVDQLHNECVAQEKIERISREIAVGLVFVARPLNRGDTSCS
jgi:hypothetical protein